MVERECDKCREETEGKHLGKIRGKMLCKKCRTERRLEHRKETREQGREYRERAMEQSKEAKAGYDKHITRRYRKKNESKEAPIPKGSKVLKKRPRYQSYLTLQEKQVLFGMLVKRGSSPEEAKERIQDLVEQQREIRESLKEENKSEDEIKQKQQTLLEELWRD